MSKDRLTIGLLAPAWPGDRTPNGIITSVANLAAGLKSIGHVPVIIGSQDGTPPDDYGFVPVAKSEWSLKDKLLAKLIGGPETNNRLVIKEIIRSIGAAHDKFGLDIVIMEETKGWPLHIAPAIPVPLVTTLHGPWKLLSEAFGRELGKADHDRIKLEARSFEMVAGLTAPSQASMAVTDKLAPNTPRAIIRNSYPSLPGFERNTGDLNRILYVGRVERLKGADTVLLAFEELAKRRPDVQLTFVGPDRGLLLDDGSTVTMEQAIPKLAPTSHDRIEYLGSVPPSKIAELRKTHRLALIASRFETLNNALLEAIANGQAVVCTDVGGPAEILTDGVTSRMVPPGEPNIMADVLERLINDPDEAGRLAANALEMLKQDFHPKVVAEQTVAFVRDVLARETHS